jgi:hypothetical protein
MKLKNAKSHALGERNTEADLIQSVIGNRDKFVFVASLATNSSSAGTVASPKTMIKFYVKDAAAGNRHTWFQGDQVTIGAFGTNGASVATLQCSPVTLNFVDGAATATVAMLDSAFATIRKTGKFNVRVKHFRCLGESIATRAVWKHYYKT